MKTFAVCEDVRSEDAAQLARLRLAQSRRPGPGAPGQPGPGASRPGLPRAAGPGKSEPGRPIRPPHSGLHVRLSSLAALQAARSGGCELGLRPVSRCGRRGDGCPAPLRVGNMLSP